ncbi:MAG TPA: GNAT family N-acetyltransferase [Bdellovibrionales bacterium]|nr:MAG: hypothetical protein A2Z97_11915 [Bdellovibrionales bacterium GWB1_52_6]OFZ05334.1 MAG: hypothetical protein A2X97_16435 [Bdellovibrionales bacterium GWA1_52_35]OFZ43329.1 MAG: hypothetical protein A2070_02875 [Bdellovibrionales bacterium GWC1_52_8]HAR41803.1 GNAT family N-acetyltransferase [Bdellovibrionales bacterium]HCM39025.1 GNAT family N-acetyltransferase [Bdellovibrionales bacterium]
MTQPTLETKRLILRPFTLGDAKDVQHLAGDPAVASTTAAIPHPYPDGAAEVWIRGQAEAWRQKKNAIFAMVVKGNGPLIGAIDLIINERQSKAELGYWVGVPYWNKGYCTEAAATIIRFGFDSLNLHKISARYIASNPASGEVMKKIGMKQEGYLREELVRNGRREDMVVYGILKAEFQEDVLKP